MKKKNLIRLQDITFGTIAVSSLFVLFGASGANATTSSVDSVSIEVPVACTMTSTVNTAHTATANVGTYQENIGETTFNVICNDANGFSVYAVGYTNDEFGNTTMKPSVLADTNAIATGLATSGDTSNWAMKLTAVTGSYAPTLETGFNAYHTVPAEYTKVASYASNTDSSSGSSFKSTYAAFIASAQPADTYTGKVKYTVVHPASKNAPVTSISELTYMQDFNDLDSEQKTLVLNSMSYNTTYNLIDNRDNKSYQIAKLKDDNIWMAQDLDLGKTILTTDLTSANTNLDANASIVTASTFNSWVKSSGTQTYTSAELIPTIGTDSTSGTAYGTLYNYCAVSAGTICSEQGANNSNATSDICPAGWRLPIGGNIGEFQALYKITDYNTPIKLRTQITNGGAGFALAGYFNNSTSESSRTYAGFYWSSTRIDGSYSYYMRIVQANYVAPVSSELRYIGGAVRCVAKKPTRSITISYGTGISNVKVDGKIIQNGETIDLEKNTYQIIATPSPGYGFSYWSTTSGEVDDTNAQATTYTLNENTTISAVASYINTEMQNLSQDNCTTTTSQARDIRDGHVYTVQRLADGKCWMMENLDLGRTELTTDLTSSNTNLTNTVTASTFNGWKKTSPISSSTYTAAEFVPADGADLIADAPYGTFYNFCAASAKTVCSANGYNNKDATSDLCPAGWRLPTGGTNSEFQALYNLENYNNYTKMRASIADGGAAFTLAGYPSGRQNLDGVFWSSTRKGGQFMDSMHIYIGVVSIDVEGWRNGWYSMRCVLDT